LKPPLAYIFDLDGTLVDSLRDIAESMNAALELLGLPPREVTDYRYMVGEGVPVLCQRLIGGTHPQYLQRLAELGRAQYRLRPLRHTRPYIGIPELIARLGERGGGLAVLSNKPQELTTLCVDGLWPCGVFRSVVGYTEERLRKPNPETLLRICHDLGVAPADALLVGDTPTDVETARNAGVRCTAVTWGFRTRQDLLAAGAAHIIDDPAELA
jgi:phosphoglycolate phosphatase